jgi:hypothetical protein
MEKVTLRLITIAALYCACCGVGFWVAGASCNTIFVMVPAVLIPVIGFFAVHCGCREIRMSYGTREPHTFEEPDELRKLKNVLWNRSNDSGGDAAFVQNGDRVVAYADRIIDREINKARGILPFNSIIMTVLSIERARLSAPAPNDLLTTSIVNYWIPIGVYLILLVILGISSWYCLLLFPVRWAPSEEYTTFRAEFDRTFDLIHRRARRILFAIVLSGASLFIGLCFVAMTEASLLSRSAP